MRNVAAAPFRRGVGRHLLAAAVAAVPVAAQTDYFNTDRGRPLHVQDALVIERYAFEFQAAPVRWERAVGPHVVWSIEPEIAYGILPRTQLEIGVPLFITDGFDDGSKAGVGALHVSVLHALNVETLGLPAFAIEAAVAIPAGQFGARRTYPSLGGVATRTIAFGRIHLNADVTAGSVIASDDPRWNTPRGAGLHELSRWTAGVALDRALPLRSLLVGAEIVAARSMREGADVEWRAAAGVRRQLNPGWAVDAGIGRSFGEDRVWSITVGAARSFGLIRLIPLGR